MNSFVVCHNGKALCELFTESPNLPTIKPERASDGYTVEWILPYLQRINAPK